MASIIKVDQIQSDSGNVNLTGNVTTSSSSVVNFGGGQFFKATNGNVGIGTSSPQRTIHSFSNQWDNVTGAGVIFENSSSVGAGVTLKPTGSVVTNGTNGWAIYAGTAGSAIGDGNVGVYAHGNNYAPFAVNRDGTLRSVVPGGTTLYPGFLCRAWVNFNGTGTPAVRASGNVSSITRRSTGQYTVNFASAMPDENYAVTTSGSQLSSGDHVVDDTSSGFITTTSVRIATWTFSGAAANDTAFVYVAIHR